MRFDDITAGMPATCYRGPGSREKPIPVIVVQKKLVRAPERKRGWKNVVRVKPRNGRRQMDVAPEHIEPIEVYEQHVKKQICAARLATLEAARLNLFNIIMQRHIVPYAVELVDDGRAVQIKINSRDLVRFKNLLRGHDGTDHQEDEEGKGKQGSESGSSEGTGEGAETELPGQVRSVGATSPGRPSYA